MQLSLLQSYSHVSYSIHRKNIAGQTQLESVRISFEAVIILNNDNLFGFIHFSASGYKTLGQQLQPTTYVLNALPVSESNQSKERLRLRQYFTGLS